MENATDRGALTTTLDANNMRKGREAVLKASAGLEGDARAWPMKQERRTPASATCKEDMPVTRAKTGVHLRAGMESWHRMRAGYRQEEP